MSLPRNLQVALGRPNFLLEAQLGQIPGARVINRFAAMTLTNTTKSFWGHGATANIYYPTTAVACEIVSDSTSDAAAGTGARTVYVEGLDASGAVVSETATLDGTTAVALGNTYKRILDMVVLTAGSGTLSAGNIHVRTVSGSSVMAVVPASQTAFSGLHYSVPTGRLAFLLSMGAEASATSSLSTLILWKASGVWAQFDRSVFTPWVRLDCGYALTIPAGVDFEPTVQTAGTNFTFTGRAALLEVTL